MRPTKFTRSESFRLAALFAALFVALTAALIGAILWIVADTQETTLKGENEEDIQSLVRVYHGEGMGETVEVVRQRLGDPQRAAARGGLYISLQDGARPLAGNLTPLPQSVGLFELSLRHPAQSMGPPRPAWLRRHASVLGRGVSLGDGKYLYVGRDTGALISTRDRILQAFLWVMCGAVLVAVGGGLMLAKRLSRRVDAIISTCEGIIAGRLNERIPVIGSGSEWDTLARAINEMLNRIAQLLDNLRQVSSDVAHDLRTPLTRMRNRLEEARTRSVSAAEYSSAVAQAIEDTDQLLSMFAALLRISQVEAGTRAKGFQRVALSDLLQSVHQFYMPVAEDHGQVLEARVTDGLAVAGDAELLFQLFSNLIENAICHAPQGTRILLEAENHGDAVLARVADNGPGIPPEEYAKITRRFYRLSSSRSEPGNGLGLALVSAIAGLHGASLNFADAGPGLIVGVSFRTASAASL